MQASEYTLIAAHDLAREGSKLTCLIHKADVAAPDKTVFVHSKSLGAKSNVRHVPMKELELQSLQQTVAHPDEGVWQLCPFGGGGGKSLSHKQPPCPSGTLLCEVSALEGFALHEEQDPVLRIGTLLALQKHGRVIIVTF